jgi:tRNA A37 threonylcarbamoyladenosine modification protein TsaB
MTLDTAVERLGVCAVGATRNTTLAETVFESVPNRITEHLDPSVAIVRGPGTQEWSFLRALRHRLGV